MYRCVSAGSHLGLDALYRPAADTELRRGLQDALARCECLIDGPLSLRVDLWSSKPFPLRPGPRQASVDPLLDHASFKLCERASDLEKQLSGWCGRVDVLLIEIQVNAGRFEVLYRFQQVPK